MRHPRVALLLAALVLLPRDGQAQRTLSVRADNDAFNFWLAPWDRPDEEYTSGVRMTVVSPGRAWWAGGRRGAGGGCGDEQGGCAEHAIAFGQNIYTAARIRGQLGPLSGARPEAGVLWLSTSSTLVRRARETEVQWTVGVTGEPALAAPLQRFFHGLGEGWNRPVDWTSQLPAEPVFAVSVDQRRSHTLGVVALMPHVGASLGNLLTEARLGIGARFGPDLRRRKLASNDRRPSVAVTGDAMLHGVVRSESLSGTFFRPSYRVAVRPVVAELQAGVDVRWGGLRLAWIAHRTSAEYRTRNGAHAWSTLEAGWSTAP